ncbi:MAG TPA: hypothetical protein VHQ46_05425 [Desulfobacteria bacterium]|nr:hypothetical protein [Desulfobacteria bacterium]
MKPLESRMLEIISQLGGIKSSSFPTREQLRVMLKAEGYPSEEVDSRFGFAGLER